MATDSTIEAADGPTIGYTDFGTTDDQAVPDHAVLWCHGGPGCRLSPAYLAPTAVAAGFRLIGIDRPGYGRSTPQPGHTIADWVDDALAVADHLGLDQFATVGTSTGGAYALAMAALVPDRITGVVACCSMTDMRHAPSRATMSRPHALDVWEADTREEAMAAALASHGADGSKIVESAEAAGRPPPCDSDLAMMMGEWGQHWMSALPEMFAQGVVGYTDDRLADGGGWTTFDVAAITCPVIVLQGDADVIVDPLQARHTAAIVPDAELRMIPGAGHFSIEDHLVPALIDLDRSTADR